MADCFKTKGKPNYKKGESANAAREKKEVTFVCMPCNEDENSHKSCGFEPVDNTIDDERYPAPDSFFDSFGGSNKEDDATAHCSAPDWHSSDEENMGLKEWCGTLEKDPVLEEKWIEVTNKRSNQQESRPAQNKENTKEKTRSRCDLP